MLLLLLMSSFALVASDVYLLQDQEYNSEPPAKPYAFSYTAGRYPGHADRQHTEVSDGSGVIRGQNSYPRQKTRMVQYVADNQGFQQFHLIPNDTPPDHLQDTEEVARGKNQNYYLYNTIAEDHQTHTYSDDALATGPRSQHHIKTVAPGAVVEEGAYVYPGAMVMSGAVIRRRAIVYDGALVKGGAVVGANSRVGNNAVVGGGAVLGNGVIMHQGAQVEDGAVLRDGVTLYDQALVKSGAVVGPYSVVGRHAVVGRGAVMGTRCTLRDGSRLGDGQVMADGEVR